MLKSNLFKPFLVILTLITISSCQKDEEDAIPPLGIFANISGMDLSFFHNNSVDLSQPSLISFSRVKSDLNYNGVTISIENVDLDNISYPFTVQDFYLYYSTEQNPDDLSFDLYSNQYIDARNDNSTLVLTGYNNDILTGNFSGTLYKRIPGVYQYDTNSPNIIITGGTFGIRFLLD
jgi:hypothetical protein